ncbi:MAG: hypothetical protein Q4D14_01820 [Bacteroidales bacterium]|nr:hypothetical protein [Bacteroidales bacterium]
METTTNNNQNIKKTKQQRRRIMKPMDVGSKAESRFKTYGDKKDEHATALAVLERVKKLEQEKLKLLKEGKLKAETTDLLKGEKTVFKAA